MTIDKRKIKIHKLIREIEKKKKLISSKSIENYIELKRAQGITSLQDGTIISFLNVQKKANERFDIKDDFQEKDGLELLIEQSAFLDDVISGDSRIRIGGYFRNALVVFLILGWILSWILDSSEEKDTSETTTSSAYTKRHIDIVRNSAWDSSVKQVEDYLKRTLKDPDSYQSIEWYKVEKTSTEYRVIHKYRAKNSFGGYVVQTTEFILNSEGDVISATNYK